jgi:hypothetical protein
MTIPDYFLIAVAVLFFGISTVLGVRNGRIRRLDRFRRNLCAGEYVRFHVRGQWQHGVVVQREAMRWTMTFSPTGDDLAEDEKSSSFLVLIDEPDPRSDDPEFYRLDLSRMFPPSHEQPKLHFLVNKLGSRDYSLTEVVALNRAARLHANSESRECEHVFIGVESEHGPTIRGCMICGESCSFEYPKHKLIIPFWGCPKPLAGWRPTIGAQCEHCAEGDWLPGIVKSTDGINYMVFGKTKAGPFADMKLSINQLRAKPKRQ